MVNADIRNSTFANTDLTNANLNGATISNVSLEGVDLRNVNLTSLTSKSVSGNPIFSEGYKIVEGYIFGPNVNLTFDGNDDGIIEGIRLGSVDLSNLNLSGANLTRFETSGVNLANTNEGANLSGSNFPDYILMEVQKSQF